MFSEKYLWMLYVAFAGLAWGCYVPLIFFGGNELGKGQAALGGRLLAILCVGVAYFVLAVLIPLVMFVTGQAPWPQYSNNGLIFSALAGVAGALGAICVIFATRAAVGAAKGAGIDPNSYKIYIAPLIFRLAPVINTVLSSFWHPTSENPFHFEANFPGWKLWLGILLVGMGAALVLFSKEEAETSKGKAHGKPVAPAMVAQSGNVGTPGSHPDKHPGEKRS